MSKFIALRYFFTLVTLIGLGLPSAIAGDAERGKILYDTYCTQCHGVTGNGKGLNAPSLSVQPRNHTDQAEMSARTDAELFKSIKFGGQSINKSILMPNWEGNLDDESIHDLVAYLRQICCSTKK